MKKQENEKHRDAPNNSKRKLDPMGVMMRVMTRVTSVLAGLSAAIFSLSALADDHGPVPVGEGAFVTLMVKAADPDSYIEMLKKNPAPFEAIGSTVAGACVTKTGADYPGQMFIWNGFDSMEEALAATDKYDANKATAELSAVREVQYNAMFKPLKAFDLEPNSERLWRLDIAPGNLNAFVKKMVQLEKALRDDGHSINIGVFQPIGGGSHETIHLRAVSPTYAESGRVLDAAFAGATWMTIWGEAMAPVEEVVSDNFKHC